MGFQSGINQALGAVAGAAYAVKSNQEKITNTKLDLDFSMAELAQAQAQSAESKEAAAGAREETKAKADAYKAAKKELDNNKKAVKKPTSEQGKFYADQLKSAEEQAFDDLMAATRAESVLNKKHFANEAMVNRFKNRVSVLQDRLSKLGGIK